MVDNKSPAMHCRRAFCLSYCDMRLVKDWKRAHRWYSTQMQALAASLLAAWALVPSNLLDAVPDNVKKWVVVAIIVTGVIGRLVDQEPHAPSPPK